MNRTDKQEMIEILRKDFSAMSGAVLADFRGLVVGKVTSLRASLRKEGIQYRVVKNTLAQKACVGTPSELLLNFFRGPTGLVYTNGDPVVLAKAISEYAAANEETFKIKTCLIEGKLVDQRALKAIAALPAKEVLVARLLRALNSPLSGLVTVLSGKQRELVTVLDAIRSQKTEKQ